ncbi:MAG: quinol:cytochrome C oxidoreductase [Bernardetiaceae bacterium]|nr:quinol:cytochrome C oxidoreductase [Bernardetiaceae bacterium]
MAAHGTFDREKLVEHFEFSAKAKKTIFTIAGIGLIFALIGIILLATDSGHDEHANLIESGNTLASISEEGTSGIEAGGHGDEHHAEYHWTQRLKANFWVNSIFFLGIAVIGVFFVAIQYVATAGWSAGIKRVPEAFGWAVPVFAGFLGFTFIWGNHELFHWTHDYLYVENTPGYDAIIAGKAPYLNLPFFSGRMIVFLAVWTLFFYLIRKNSLAEDKATSFDEVYKKYRNMVKLSAGFLVFFAVSSSMAAWDWVLSIDTHWFSTMFGWYVFASWWVSGLAAITLAIILIKEAGYLKFINENHLHDMGKYVFAFSIFWTYIWFSQFLLIYYANIPEETIYFIERLGTHYAPAVFVILILNFAFPFLFLMTRESKRKHITLKIAAIAVLIGHYIDFWLMITPGTLKEHGSFGFLEAGLPFVFVGIFAYIVCYNLAKNKDSLVAKNHPLLEEAYNHHI